MLKNSCFISYQKETGRIAQYIRDDLSNELELLLEEPVRNVYLDTDRLQGAVLYNKKLAEALCQSVCMVVIFTPIYFSEESNYCAKEYWAMEKLEEERLNLLESKSDGFIIPIVIRGKNKVPSHIKGTRHLYDFEMFYKGGKDLNRTDEYHLKIIEIADYITERYWALKPKLEGAAVHDCSRFEFPDKLVIEDWLKGII